jgi:CrcB protein
VTRVLIVFGAGGAGCVVRYLISLWAGDRFGTAFPYGTLIVNLVGSFLMTLVMDVSLRLTDFPNDLRLALATGFLGGLTTYSSFNYETSTLAYTGDTWRAFVNLALTLITCLAAGFLGLALSRAVVR